MKERFEFSKSRRSVRRIVHRPDDSKVVTLFRLKQEADSRENAHASFDGAYLRKSNPTHFRRSNESVVRVADLFCGCGGLSLGAREACVAAGSYFHPVVALDKDLDSLKVYAHNFGCTNILHRDVVDVIDGQLGNQPTVQERKFAKNCGEIHILLAGPPCQGHSDLNNHTRRHDARNALYERMARAAEIIRPTHILIENVPTVVHDRQRTVQRTIEVLDRLGYQVDSGIVDLGEIGVPQRRKRHVVVASLYKTLSIKDVIQDHRVDYARDVMWAIGDLECESPNGIFTTPSRLSNENIERIDYLHDHDVYDLPNWLRPKCHSDGNHTYKSMYGRIRPNECAQTITGGFGSPGQGRFVHPTQRRTLTPHEAARLQFLPDFFDFSAIKMRTLLARMIGNAVPMKLSYIFCLEFLA